MDLDLYDIQGLDDFEDEIFQEELPLDNDSEKFNNLGKLNDDETQEYNTNSNTNESFVILKENSINIKNKINDINMLNGNEKNINFLNSFYLPDIKID